ncbi:MAG: LytR C-terminal domain-containing protein, partial [Pseudonocardia sp.]|nr:LytR C-terminal domain-containing protein [Pseudonocardia sp.]
APPPAPARRPGGQPPAGRPARGGGGGADRAGLDEILAVALSLRRLDAPRVTFTAVPTTGETSARGNAVVRDDAAALFTALRTNATLPDTAGGPDAGVAPSDVTVQIVNASDRAGLASEVGETLRSLGFGIGEPVNADQPTPQTLVRFSPDQVDAAELLAATVPSATSVPDPGATGVLQLVLGSSFDDVVRAPTEPAGLAPSANGADLPQAEC